MLRFYITFVIALCCSESNYAGQGPAGDPAASLRLSSWSALKGSISGLSEHKQLAAVNAFVNSAVTYREDIDAWGEVDYWATPLETMRSGFGDCEDFALAKYFLLVDGGVPQEKLRITYVKHLELNRAHMVLTYFESLNSVPLVLDNVDQSIQLATERKELLPVYSFDDTSIYNALKGTQIKSGDSRKISKWSGLQRRMRDEGAYQVAMQNQP